MAPTSSTTSNAPGVDLDPLRTRRTAVALQFASVTKSVKGRPRFVISTEDIDLHGDIVVQAGLKPVGPRIPAQVDHSGKMRDVIGWWDDIETQGKRTLADLVLFEPGVTPIADMVRAMHDAGVRLASSIGFVPSFEDGSYELIRDPSNDYVTGIKYLRSTLIETSVVVVPANPGALSMKALDVAKRFGFVDEQKFSRFVMSEASQQVLRTVPRSDALARGAAALTKATAALQRGRS